ncbi:MAG: hypothetical protein AAGM38_03715 [Pseudomonadota bacterium]
MARQSKTLGGSGRSSGREPSRTTRSAAKDAAPKDAVQRETATAAASEPGRKPGFYAKYVSREIDPEARRGAAPRAAGRGGPKEEVKSGQDADFAPQAGQDAQLALATQEMVEAKRSKLAQRAQPGLSQTNRGLRMILVSTVIVVGISWAATVSTQYIEYLKVQELAEGDPNALRVMCALKPPSNVSLIHLCETVAKMPLDGSAPAVDAALDAATKTANAE